jgi:sarcosine oxidase subunit alpha
VQVRAPREIAKQIAGIRPSAETLTGAGSAEVIDDSSVIEGVVCRCERVTAEEIRTLIHSGVRDMNHIKAVTRAGMGACGGKTCANLIKRLFREEGVELEQVVENTQRPLFVEVELGAFAGVVTGERPADEPQATHAADVHEWGM